MRRFRTPTVIMAISSEQTASGAVSHTATDDTSEFSRNLRCVYRASVQQP
jgi:hypothetical protein